MAKRHDPRIQLTPQKTVKLFLERNLPEYEDMTPKLDGKYARVMVSPVLGAV